MPAQASGQGDRQRPEPLGVLRPLPGSLPVAQHRQRRGAFGQQLSPQIVPPRQTGGERRLRTSLVAQPGRGADHAGVTLVEVGVEVHRPLILRPRHGELAAEIAVPAERPGRHW